MNLQNMKLIFILPILSLFSYTPLKQNLKRFCKYFEVEQMDSCRSILNNYLELKGQNNTPHQEYSKQFHELDTLTMELSKLPCIDSCFYINNKNYVMESLPPMIDVFIYKLYSTDTLKYLMRVRFDEPLKVVWIRRWEE